MATIHSRLVSTSGAFIVIYDAHGELSRAERTSEWARLVERRSREPHHCLFWGVVDDGRFRIDIIEETEIVSREEKQSGLYYGNRLQCDSGEIVLVGDTSIPSPSLSIGPGIYDCYLEWSVDEESAHYGREEERFDISTVRPTGRLFIRKV